VTKIWKILKNSYLCTKGKKCPSLSFLAEAQPKLKTGEEKRHFLSDRTNYKAEDIIGKITNLFCIYSGEQ
jgi:hypothetical protein